MKVLFPSLHGNGKIKNLLANDILTGKNAHAYIIAGPRGSGKHTVALEAAAALGCTNRDGDVFPCGECLHCKKVKRGVMPDVIFVNREDKATLGVEVIREVKNDVYLAPNEAPYKVYIIEEADKMTPQAQNAFLLTLEEPPAFVVFFLLSETPENLLETVRSRAPVLTTEQFSPAEIVGYIRGLKGSMSADKEKRLADASSVSSGTIGQALELIAESDARFEESLSPRKSAERIFRHFCRPSAKEAISLIYDMPKGRADVVEILEYAFLAVRDGCVLKKSPMGDTVFFSDTADVKQIIKNVPFSRLYKIGEAVTEAISDINRNASVQTVLTSLFLKKYS